MVSKLGGESILLSAEPTVVPSKQQELLRHPTDVSQVPAPQDIAIDVLLQELMGKIEGYGKNIQELQSSNHNLLLKVNRLESSNSSLQSSNTNLLSKVNWLESSNSRLESSNSRLESSNSRLASSNAELSGKVAQLTDSNNQMFGILQRVSHSFSD